MSGLRRWMTWLVPARRRDWIEAVWAEAYAVPPGLPRLAWRAGGIWMLARELLRPRRLAKAALFAAAAAAAAWAAWPAPGVGHAAVSRFHVIVTVLLLAGLPLLARRFLGPASPSRAGRALRAFSWAAILALLPAMAVIETFADLTPARPGYRRVFCGVQGCGGMPGRSTGGPSWLGEVPLLVLTLGYVVVVLLLTSRRFRVARSTLAIGTGTGLLLGLVVYAVAPLGVRKYSTDPWLPGAKADPLVVLAWVLLLGGPAVAGVLASRRGRGPDGVRPPVSVRIGQGAAAGILASLTGAVLITALGTGTIALMLESAGLRHWLEHGQQLTMIATYRAEIYASTGAAGYALIWISFPAVGLIMSSIAATIANSVPREPDPRPAGRARQLRDGR